MKYLLSCLCVCISFGLFAQSESNKYISTGIKFGSDIGLIALKTKTGNTKTNLDFGYTVMVDFVEFRFHDRYGVNLSVGFSNRKYRQTSEDTKIPDITRSATVEETLLLQNVEVPLTFRYYLPTKSTNRQFYFSAGGSLYFNLYSQFQQEVFFKENTWEFNHQSEIQRTTFASNFSLGIQFFTDYKISYYLEPTIQINSNRINFQYGNNSSALVNIGVLGGLKF